jgi:hypothetical protein
MEQRTINGGLLMANDKKKKTPWPTKAQTRGNRRWVPNPKRKGWEINVMTMDERKIKRKK